MKKAIKISALCLSLIMLTALFSGCNSLDKLKANHALLSSDKQSISYKGESYKRLPEGIPPYMAVDFEYNNSNVNVTDSDVPVLLSGSFCYLSKYDNIRDIFEIYISDEHVSDWFYFCNEKSYSDYINAMESGSLNRIGIEYEKEYFNGNEFMYSYVLDICDKALSDEILSNIKNPVKMTNKAFEAISEDYTCESLIRWMYKCDENGMIAESLFDSYDLIRTSDGDAYLADYHSETAVKLSAESAFKLKDVYFYGDFSYD